MMRIIDAAGVDLPISSDWNEADWTSGSKAEHGSIYLEASDVEGELIIQSHQGSNNIRQDVALIDRAILFREAAQRQGKVFICEMIRPWQARVLKWIGVEIKGW